MTEKSTTPESAPEGAADVPDAAPAQAAAPARRTRTRPAAGDAPAVEPTPPEALNGLTAGRVVHFVVPDLANGLTAQAHRPAIVTHVEDPLTGRVSLSAFVRRGDYPMASHPGPVMMLQEVEYDEAGGVCTWHWPERA